MLIGCSGAPGGSSSDVTLSGVISTGTTTVSTDGGVHKTTGGVSAAATSLSGYSLYCVTFTNPPQSGTGSLTGPDSSGQYSYHVTLTNAAGLPIGCFITDSTDTPVSTVTFNVVDSSGLNSSNSGAALGGGSHTVNITFDPTTGASSADITSSDLDTTNSASSTDAASLLTTMAGAWNMACPDPAPTGVTNGQDLTPTQYNALSACQKMLMTNYSYYDAVNSVDIYSWNGAGGMPVYLNFVSGTQGGNPVYAMGVWPSQTQFTSCGSTEGMSSTALGYHSVTVTGQTSSGNPVGTFTGIHTALAGAGPGNYDIVYDSVNNNVKVSGVLGTIEATLNGGGSPVYAYNSNFDDSNGDWCTTATDGLPNFIANSDLGRQERSCYADFMGWSLRDRAQSGSDPAAACAPVLDSNTLYQTIWNWDPTLNAGAGGYTNADANITVPFRTNLGGISPEIGGRYALMGLELVSGAGIANDHHEDHWSYWDSSTSQTFDCKFVEDLSINMVPAADGLSAVGHFTIKDWQGCSDAAGNPVTTVPGSGDQFNTFDVSFAR